MPQAKIRPSDIALEAKRIYIPLIEQYYQQPYPNSISYRESSDIQVPHERKHKPRKLRVAVFEGNSVDLALDWHDANSIRGITEKAETAKNGIPVVHMANDKRAGGDWESKLIAPEENLCRRSNLIRALTTPDLNAHYPIQNTGGIYSPHVVVFRSGAENNYKLWRDHKCLPVISVAPVRRPRLDISHTEYVFDEEKNITKDLIRTVLRIAHYHGHEDICICAFGIGPNFLHPTRQVASMWKDVLFSEAEFQGAFSNVVFVIESGPNSYLGDEAPAVLEIFRREFDPANVVPTTYR